MMNYRTALLVACLALPACDDPFQVDPVRAYKAVTTGGDHSCAISEAGEAYCWGSGADGQLGIGERADRATPTRVLGGLTFDMITAGASHTCALTTAGDAYCWGWNAFYQRGNPTDPRAAEPVKVTTDVKFRSISAGEHHTCALGVDSLAWCWGNGRYGQLGLGSQNTGIQPFAVVGGRKYTQISAGAWHTCGLIANGTAFCWGSNETGQLGIASNTVFSTVPVLVGTTLRFRQINGGATHTCATATDGRFYCWGSNAFGELGDGGTFKPGLPASNGPSPVSTLFPSGSAIFAGTNHTCAIAGSNAAGRCWGRGEFGQLGNGGLDDNSHPQPVHLQPTRRHTSDLLRFGVIGAGGTTHVCALVETSVYCWGTGRSGQLGLAGSTFAPLPQRVQD